MKQKGNAGFSLVEVVVAIAILAIIVVPMCSGMVLSARMNAKAEATLQARLAVSSALETLMAEGITKETYSFPDVTVQVTQEDPEDPAPAYYIVTVFDGSDAAQSLVSVTTKIRAAQALPDGEGGTE